MHDVDPEAINAETRPELGYEYRDVNTDAIWKTFKWFVGFGTFFVVISIGIQWFFTKTPPGASYREEHQLVLPKEPNPMLQTADQAKLDIINMRRSAKTQLETYGQNVDTGVTRVPIKRAMEIVSEKGLNTPAQPLAK